MRHSVEVASYLSKIVVPIGLLDGEKRAHRIFWKAFPGHSEGSPQVFLFREEPFAPVEKEETAFIVQSQARPSWEDVMGLRVVSCEHVKADFARGDHFFFRLLASPVRRLMSPEKIHARGHERVERSPQRTWTQGWFERRAEQSGFSVRELIFDLSERRIRKAERGFHLASVQFDGLLQVTAPENFAAAWLTGIGTKKSFGFGLLSLKRA